MGVRSHLEDPPVPFGGQCIHSSSIRLLPVILAALPSVSTTVTCEHREEAGKKEMHSKKLYQKIIHLHHDS